MNIEANSGKLMKSFSIFNDVLGPVMRGPSSSHTAGSQRIGLLARELFGGAPANVRITFDRNGSYAQVYRQQGSDLAFASGLLGWDITDERFFAALETARQQGLDISFAVGQILKDNHPNAVEIDLRGRGGERLELSARSTGGGRIEIIRIDGWPLSITGEFFDVLVEIKREADHPVRSILIADSDTVGKPERIEKKDRLLIHAQRISPLNEKLRLELESTPGVVKLVTTSPLVSVIRGEPLFEDCAEMISMAEECGLSLGQLAIEYESRLLGLTENDVADEMVRRFEVMGNAVRTGLQDINDLRPMQLLSPTADEIFRAEAEARLPIGGMHTRAAARAMAVMHVNGAMGVVCAAPTGGSAGVIPGVMVTLERELGLSREKIIKGLFAASAIGLAILQRGTFAAEEAGCQVEIGAAGAMAAAAVVEAAGGSPSQAADAAAISLQNTMGSVCDLVQGIVEIPCHTRNAVAASSALVCADLILGGYVNPIPLEETIDAAISAGRSLPPELRCTARGGLAMTPSTMNIPRRKR